MSKSIPMNYKDAGVDIDAGNRLVNNIKSAVKRTHRSEVMGNLGGFGALCELPTKYKQPVLVAGTDGVGTKLRLAIDFNQHQNVGIDLVAMCVNDLIVQGAEPLFFLDYYATGKLDVDTATAVVNGIAEGCAQSACALIGGETAEMPGMYADNDFDLAGFCVGVVEKNSIIDGNQVSSGDVLIALGSSGPHSNGYSLIRKVLQVSGVDPQQLLNSQPLIEHLLTPTKIYVNSVLKLVESTEVHGMSHITGGGFWENIPRMLPSNCKAIIKADSWQWPAIFHWLMQQGNISKYEMYRTFNCGVGMIIALPQGSVTHALNLLKSNGEQAWIIGEIQTMKNCDDPQVEIQ